MIKIVDYKPASNYHTHCLFCDGKGRPEDYVKEAIKLGFTSLGFSSHAPLPFPTEWTMKEENLTLYIDEIKNLKEKYKNQIEIYCGLEIDYLEGISGPNSTKFKDLPLDYTIGSVHLIKNENTGNYLPIDNTKEDYKKILEVFFKGHIKAFTAEYYRLIREMLSNHKPHILGHIDLIRKNNSDYFSEEEDWYRQQVFETLDLIKDSKVILEVNTGAMARGYLSTPYPSFWILKRCCEMDIPITLNSDAHSPENLNFYFKESLNLIKQAGYRNIYEMNKGSWVRKEII